MTVYNNGESILMTASFTDSAGVALPQTSVTYSIKDSDCAEKASGSLTLSTGATYTASELTDSTWSGRYHVEITGTLSGVVSIESEYIDVTGC